MGFLDGGAEAAAGEARAYMERIVAELAAIRDQVGVDPTAAVRRFSIGAAQDATILNGDDTVTLISPQPGVAHLVDYAVAPAGDCAAVGLYLDDAGRPDNLIAALHQGAEGQGADNYWTSDGGLGLYIPPMTSLLCRFHLTPAIGTHMGIRVSGRVIQLAAED